MTEDEFNLSHVPEVDDSEGGGWSVKLFRSITDDSCHFAEEDSWCTLFR